MIMVRIFNSIWGRFQHQVENTIKFMECNFDKSYYHNPWPSIVGATPLGFQIKDQKLFLVISMVVIVLVISAFGYGWIIKEEARTGGMGEKWHMATSGTLGLDIITMRPDGSILLNDYEHHLISLVDPNGMVEWSHDYGSYLGSCQINGDEFYMIAVSESGNYTLDCITMDGVWKSSMPFPSIDTFTLGPNGPDFAIGNKGYNSTIYNIEGGSINWAYTQNGSLAIGDRLNDGRVLLRHVNASFNTADYDVNEIVMLSSMGIPEWKRPFPHVGGYYGTSTAEIAANGTIVAVRQVSLGGLEEARLTQGYTTSGDLVWAKNESFDFSIARDPYFTSKAWAGNVISMSKVDPTDSSRGWNVMLNDTQHGSIYEMDGMEFFLSSDGQAFGLDSNGKILWHINTGIADSQLCEVNDSQGLLLRTDYSILKIGMDGSFWVFDVADSSIRDARFGSYNTVYVMASDKMVVLDKPTVSTPTEYLIAMLSVDMLVVLSSALWIADRLIKKPN
jgi:hypothetical protein